MNAEVDGKRARETRRNQCNRNGNLNESNAFISARFNNMSNMKGGKTTTHSIKHRVIDLSTYPCGSTSVAVATGNFIPVFSLSLLLPMLLVFCLILNHNNDNNNRSIDTLCWV